MRMTRIHELSAFGNQTIVIRSLFAVHDGVFAFGDFRFAHATHSDATRNFKQRRNREHDLLIEDVGSKLRSMMPFVNPKHVRQQS